jgi:hypothetical protein
MSAKDKPKIKDLPATTTSKADFTKVFPRLRHWLRTLSHIRPGPDPTER